MKIKAILASVLALGLCACTSDDVLTESADNSSAASEGVYMKFSISLPTSRGTRSVTDENGEDDYVVSTGGIEVGKDYENNINSLLVVLTDANNKYVASVGANIGDHELTQLSDDTYELCFSDEGLTDHINETLNIYVYCNPTDLSTTADFDPDAIYTISDPESDPAWKANHMLMSNAKPASSTMPGDFTTYTSEENPWDLGTVYVERSVARFDYKGGSGNEDDPNTYDVGSLYNGVNADPTPVSVTLTHVAVINMSNNFYHLRRTAADGGTSEAGYPYANYGSTNLLGTEVLNNWVIDTDAAAKYGFDADDFKYSTYFSYPLVGVILDDLEWASLTDDVTEDDNSEEWTDNTEPDENVDKEGYHIWRYVTENTIPSVDDQKNGISTGVVFKGIINVDVAEGTILYAYGDVVYAGWDGLVAAVEADGGETSDLAEAYEKVLEQMGDDDTEPTVEELVAAGADITAYEANDDGEYEVYYYYWNRHNDNGYDNVMGRMEFAVVRNNIYKLSVTEISKFGYPETEIPDPDNPDETTDYYFKVQVVILPWVVRVNNITF